MVRGEQFHARADVRIRVHGEERAPSSALPLGEEFVAAERAQPGEERRLAAPGFQAANSGDECGLDGVLGRRDVTGPPEREPEETLKITREELVEGLFVARAHAMDGLLVIHARRWACFSGARALEAAGGQNPSRQERGCADASIPSRSPSSWH